MNGGTPPPAQAGRIPGWLHRFVPRFVLRPSILELVLTAGWAGLAVVALSNAAVDLLAFMVLAFGMLALGGLWCFRLMTATFLFLAKRRLFGRAIAWCILPLALGVAAGLVWHDIGLRLRLRLSEHALSAFVETVPLGAHEDWREHPRRVGMFRILEVERIDDCVRFITTPDYLDDAGLAYSPQGRPPRTGEDHYTHLRGPWYKWNRSW
jgi:hypothetical protein